MYFFHLRHLVSIKDLVAQDINYLLDRANEYLKGKETREKLSDLTQINIFFEPSTRTRTSFEIAGKKLGINVINITTSNSSMKKGESLIDTITTLNAMRSNIIIIRHPCSGAIHSLIDKIDGPAIINAGDGTHEHPTQALIDALAIRNFKGTISNIRIAICGDILHSRVARSNIMLLNTMGARVRVIAPTTLIPTGISNMGVEVFHDLKEGLRDVDVIMVLRIQHERMSEKLIPSIREYTHMYSINEKTIKYAKKDAIVMHPGPINRNFEISSEVADSSQSIIKNQVEMGVPVRMAVIKALIKNHNNLKKKKS
ncbi:aspartate carbamoyltransferase catalytic subunit [Candidatus Liberibacter americanus]|uniref:Aspartate carbamoyltransferase n=1 Tax=Candidatus Liberibacter americanus str. Sao Paulo TaxID=1261131 RepID=U6B3X1_9HYPH|nr:aspartate carbamoyltransferase catalytic subunit [Candidatus Liberibacter americanus]AHA27749.1 Aspartate carbamoyltransferase, catalytic chain [Candidatus Liberibacter americanus str. Sao Paulo]EMS36134.1 aspartate carbamoyltransferase catalytic subunit [Candidatus Liberibacter americanus PW_SP]